MIGGKGVKRLLKAAARWADHYNYPGSDIEDFRYRLDALRGLCEKVGRDRAEIETSLQILVEDVPEAVELAGSAGEAGADHIIFYFRSPPGPSLLDSIAEEAAALV